MIHNPEKILFAWGQDEEEGAYKINLANLNWIKAPKASGLYLAPSLFPIWLEGVTEVAVLKDAEHGIDVKHISSEAIYGFKTSSLTFQAEVTTDLFAGYKEEGGNTSISFMGTGKETQTETEKSSYSLLLWDIDKDEFISRQINNNKWFPEPSSWGSYSAAGTLVSGIDEFTFMPCGHLLRDYAESPIMDSRILRTAIYKDPCLLEHPFVPMGEGLGYETEFMKGLNTMVGAGLAAAFFPAAVKIILVPILEQSLPVIVNEGASFYVSYLTRKKAIDVAVGVTLDVTLQSFILHVFEDVHLSEVPGKIDYYQTTISGTEALIDNKFLETFITPLYGAFFDNGKIKEDVQFERVYSDYLQGAATALIIRIATERAPGAGKALKNNLIKLKGIANKSLPDFKLKLRSKGVGDADIDKIVRYLDELEGDGGDLGGIVKGADDLLAIGENIIELTSPPIGYSFYKRADGKKWIRRINAADPNTPRLTVKDGKIVRFTGATDANQPVEFVYHVKSDKFVQNVIDDIEPAFFSDDSRFGGGFYIASDGETAIAEVLHHGGEAGASKVIRFTIDKTQLKILDLTDVNIANIWKLQEARAFELSNLGSGKDVYYRMFQEIAQKAKDAGYNTIRFNSFRNPGGINYVILDLDKEFYKQVLKPQMVMPGIE